MLKRRWLLIAFFFLFPLILRLAYLYTVKDQPLIMYLVEDEKSYHDKAVEIASGNWLGDEIFYQSPLYPYFIAVIYAFRGGDPVAVRLVQAVLGALSCLMLFWVGSRLFGVRSGVVSGFMASLYGVFIFYEGLVLKTSLVVFFTSLLLLLLARLEGTSSPWSWMPPGMCLGLLVLLRGNVYAYLPLLLAWIVISQRSSRLGKAALFLGGTACVLLPVMIRNVVVGGDAVLTESQAGTNFYIGNNPRATGTYVPLRSGRHMPVHEREDAFRLAVAETGRELKPSEVSRFWFSKSWDFIKSEPLHFVRLTLRKLYLFFAGYEVPDTQDYYTYRNLSPLLKLSFFNFSIVLTLGLWGLFFAWKNKAAFSLLLTLVLAAALSVVPFYIFSRYRIMVVPPLIILGGYGALNLYETVRRKDLGKALSYAFVSIVVLAAINIRSVAQATPALSLYNTAFAFSESGDRKKALRVINEAIAADPSFSESYILRGILHEEEGLQDRALEDFTKYIALLPGEVRGYARRANFFMEGKEYGKAINDYTGAIRLDPEASRLYHDRGIVRGESGDFRGAATDMLIAVRLDPKNIPAIENIRVAYNMSRRDETAGDVSGLLDSGQAPAFEKHLALGYIHFMEGRNQEALDEFTLSMALNSQNPVVYNYRGLAYLNMGLAEEALEEFSRAVQVDARYPDSYNHLGLVYLGSGDYGRALESFNSALSMKPDDALYYMNRAAAFKASGEPRMALGDYEKSVALDPDDPRIYRQRAALYREMDRGALAAEDERRARELEVLRERRK